MYQEEYFLEDASVYSANTSKFGSNDSQKKALKDLYKEDPGFYRVKKTLPNRMRVRYECFATNTNKNSLIRNAITGEMTGHRAGSKHQDFYFKVIDVSGLGGTTKIPKHLFYDSPEQYEKHQFTTVSQSVKESWVNRYMKALNKKQ